MKYEGNICNVCGRPMTEHDTIPKRLVTMERFGTEPRCYVEIYLDLKEVTYGCFSDAQNPDGHICIECLCDVLKEERDREDPRELEVKKHISDDISI